MMRRKPFDPSDAYLDEDIRAVLFSRRLTDEDREWCRRQLELGGFEVPPFGDFRWAIRRIWI